jgi:flagellar FliL protein
MLIVLITGAWFFLSDKGSEDGLEDQHVIDTNDNMQTALPQEPEIIFEDIIDFEPFEFVRLKSGSAMGTISVNLSLELTDQRFRKQIYTMEDEIRDVITEQIAKMDWLELRNPEGKIMLKYNMIKRINSMFPKATVRNIYFTYFIMQ